MRVPCEGIHKKPSESLGADSSLRLEISIYCLPRNFNRFPLYFGQCSFTEMKSTFVKLQNESLLRNNGQELLIVNNVSYFLHGLESVTSNL